ncbi:MAG: PA14 domain-containing protein [Ferruginibacter sp.]
MYYDANIAYVNMPSYNTSSYKQNANSFTNSKNAVYENKTKANTLFNDDKNRSKDKGKKVANSPTNRHHNFSVLNGKAKLNHPFIGGPSQPEMAGFKSVGTDNMVSPFTGDFSYNIPLFDVGGYPINMFYNSGISMDQESSWLGLGWNINPGTITRNMRGLPDDFNGADKVVKTQSFRDDKTYGITTGANIKIAGFKILNVGASWGLAWNNKLGISAEAGINAALSIGGKNGDTKTAPLKLSASLNGSSRNGASFSPTIQLMANSTGNYNATIGVGYTYNSRRGLTDMHVSTNASLGNNNLYQGTSSLSFAYPSIMPSISKPFTRANYSLDFSMGFEMFSVEPHFKFHGYYSKMYLANSDKKTEHKAYGMLNLQKAEGNDDALLDFNRANDGVYTPNSPTIALPVYTYDVFNISGEGTGGSFRAYRGDVGHMRDAKVKTKENAYGIGVDLGFASTTHVGADLSYVHTPTEAGDWSTNNMAKSTFAFQNNDGTYQAAYFKNPNEKTVPDPTFQNAVANEDLVRLKMTNTASANPMLLSKLIRYDANKNFLGEKSISTNDTKKVSRDKRTQVISFLTAEESERIGMNKKIYSYNTQGINENHTIFSVNCNKAGIDSFYRNQEAERSTNPPDLTSTEDGGVFRKAHHISEIDVLGSDGKKYVYGLPVYNKKQYNVTFNIDQSQKKSDSKALYANGEDNTTGNTKGRDWFMEKEEMPAYTHSYLLTELTSPNYVDVTGNGITEDDMGDAVKFNYSKADDYKWRTPVGKDGDEVGTGSYSSGLKTDEKDDKAHYIYGEREAWYMYSIESKNMVARFYLKSDRKDGRPVTGESGALDLSANKGMKRLDKISLFSKGDLAKLGDAAKPIKTVRFFQSYKLCKNVPAANDLGSNIEYGQGKLTLDSLWVTYNGNQRKPKSRYVFYYPDNTNNPNYNFDQSDRWSSYKPKTDNPNSLSNEEYPYSIQNQTKADKNVAAWTMNKILMPSGGVINIDYESDTYAYVQNKKAASMCQVLGFGTSGIALPSITELPKIYDNGGVENDYVYIQLPYSITATGANGREEFAARYLKDVKQLYLKLAVTMPMGSGLSGLDGSETIPVYADIADYGLISSSIAWVKVGNVTSGHTPMVQGALQFLTQQLPGKAYKGYDLSEESGMKSVIMAMGGMLTSIGTMFSGELNKLKSDLKCQQVVLEKSFAKLTHPTRNKFGGGLRVKRITINDNWAKMTNQLKSTYGQEYKYTTTELINDKLETISSGVASWEPNIGADENPHREIMRYMDHNRGGPYDFGAIEMPLGEMFYPAASVGYSKVEVLSIHRDTVKNLPTREVTEFYTNKDFPYKSSCTDLTGDANSKYEPSKIMQILKIDCMKGVAQSQGFLVETNDMNGKEKSKSTYTATDLLNPVSYVQNFYNIKQATDNSFAFEHNFPTISKADGKVTSGLIGRDIELMTDFRQHRSETFTTNISINFDMFMIAAFPVPLFNLLQPVVREGTTYSSAAVLKVVNHYGMLDSVVSIDKGSMVSTKNLVYDAETGNPLLTRTQNEHNKPVYNFNYPAHWAYSGMGAAYKNIDAKYSAITFVHGIWRDATNEFLDTTFESGDEIYVVAMNRDSTQPVLPCDDPLGYTPSNFPWATLAKNGANRIWAVNTAKAGDANPHPRWVFMDANGYPFNAVNASIRIVRSGRRNMLDQSVAAITSLNNPIINDQLLFNEATNIIQTTAATFKDNWRVDNSFYRKIEQVDSSVYARVHRADLIPTGFASVVWDKYSTFNSTAGINHGNHSSNYTFDNGDYMTMYKHSNREWVCRNTGPFGSQCCKEVCGSYTQMRDLRKNIFLQFTGIPPGTRLYKSMLSLYSHSNSTVSNEADATHSGLHGASTPQGTSTMWGEVFALNRGWLSTSSAPQAWTTTYFNSSNVTASKGIISPSNLGWNNYFLNQNTDTRVNVSLPMRTRDTGPLSMGAGQVGFKLSLANDQVMPESWGGPGTYSDFRCFWSKNVLNGGKTAYVKPILSYYYYTCGDVTPANLYSEIDPSVNTLVTCIRNIITGSFCRSKFERKGMNPYVEGVLGNWRLDSTYAYYGARKEIDPAVTVDTRTAGTIKAYKTFWDFASTGSALPITRNQQATDVWVWNSAITQYNRKGYEIENTDPLGRFNAGLYGYNQQLPIGVANNARVREVMYDGFEDYDYQTSAGCIDCKPHRQFNYTTSIASNIDATQKHTGRYSLRVNANSSIKLQAPITSLAESDRPYGLTIKGSTFNYTNTSLSGGGTNVHGLKANWFTFPSNGAHPPLEPPISNTLPPVYTENTTDIRVSGSGSPKPQITQEYFSVRWSGQIQCPANGNYRFRSQMLDDGYKIKINGTTLSHPNQWADGNTPRADSDPYAMVVGQVYTIEICYYNWTGPYGFNLQWNRDGGGFTSIPPVNLYLPTATQFQTVTTAQLACNRLDSSQVKGNALTDTFSLLQGQKMLLSAWVKVGIENCCFPATYDDGTNNISITFTNPDGSMNTLPGADHPFKPSGAIIEGWQRYEAKFEVPNTAISIATELKNTNSSKSVFFDDLRIQPCNANMKTFVYHSSNLRLMAELDENNYASFYEYDDDGTLTRVKKEAQRGVKTITETRSATQKKIINE